MASTAPAFISLTEVFAVATKTSEAPHTWRRRLRAAFDPEYNYDAQFEIKPGARQVLERAENIRRVDEYCGDFYGAKAKVWLWRGSPLLVKEDVAAIQEKISRAWAPR